MNGSPMAGASNRPDSRRRQDDERARQHQLPLPPLLVPLHSDYDGLNWAHSSSGRCFAPTSTSMLRAMRLPSDEARAFEGQHHLVN